MQGANENFSSPLNAPLVDEEVPQYPVRDPTILFPTYHQHPSIEVNHMSQSHVTNEFATQNVIQERGMMCINFIEEMMAKNSKMWIRNQELGMCLNNALAEVEYWKQKSHEKTIECNDLASRLVVLEKREVVLEKKEYWSRKRTAERDPEEEEEESSGDDEEDDDDDDDDDADDDDDGDDAAST